MQKTQLLLILAFLAVTSRSIAALPAAISKTRSVAELEKLEKKTRHLCNGRCDYS